VWSVVTATIPKLVKVVPWDNIFLTVSASPAKLTTAYARGALQFDPVIASSASRALTSAKTYARLVAMLSLAVRHVLPIPDAPRPRTDTSCKRRETFILVKLINAINDVRLVCSNQPVSPASKDLSSLEVFAFFNKICQLR